MPVNIYAPTDNDALSAAELELYNLIMDYRASLGLDAIPLSTGLTLTAGRHAVDTTANIWDEGLILPDGANLHSWSDAPYYSDHRDPTVMWEAPERLGTSYPGYGFEISAAGYSTSAEALEGWKSSAGHNAVIANLGGWANYDWTSIGVGIEQGTGGPYGGLIYHVWFGVPADPDGSPEILGTVDAENFVGSAFADSIVASDGDDTLDGGLGADVLNGGPGSDLFIVDDADDIVLESYRWAGHDTVESSVSFRMGRQHIEDLRLTGDAVIGAGNGLENHIWGNDADNILDGGKGVDTLEGGAGDDTYLIRSPGDNAVEADGAGLDTVKAFRGHKLEANIERLFLQTVYTKDGDPLQGMNAIGNGLDNVIVGNVVDNFIGGLGGNDVLNGNLGDDVFMFVRGAGDANADRVVDFNIRAGEADSLLFASAAFTALTPGSLDAGAFHLGTEAATAAHRFVFDQGSGNLWYDADGTGALGQELVAWFDNGATVSASDFEII